MSERDRSQSSRPQTSSASSAYHDAARYLGPRPRSVLELRRHLTKRRYDEKEIALAIERLREQGYVDDRAFAEYWLDQRARFRPKGAVALKSELRAKGIDASLVDEVLGEGERDEPKIARAALASRLARWQALDPRDRKTKAQAFLRQRGFSFDTIDEVLGSLDE